MVCHEVISLYLFIRQYKMNKRRTLHSPKLTPITKQQYRKFVVVRKLHTQPLGEHILLSHNHKKYILKSMGVGQSFYTLRAPSQHIYHYTEEGSNCYIFQLLGEPLLNILRGSMGQQIKDWFDRCGGFDNSLLELLRYCVKMYVEKGVDDLVSECFRVWEGKVCYHWDSWMRGSVEIVAADRLQIENYFLSDHELRYIQTIGSTVCSPNAVVLTHHQYLYKLGLFFLNLALPEIKTRNYQYCQFSLNHANIAERLNLLKIKANKQLYTLVSKFINFQVQNIDHLPKLLQRFRHGRGESPSMNLQASGCKSALKIWQKDKENIHVEEDSFLHSSQNQNQKFLTAIKVDPQFNKLNSIKKIRGRGKSGSINQSMSMTTLAAQQQKKINTKYFSLRQAFSKPPPEPCSKILEYLGLNEHISQSLYEKSVIGCLDALRMKQNWVHRIYANGSVYLGEMSEDKRTGKGVYLFDSEDLYVGDWSENCIHGQGCYVFRSGEIYKGELRKGLKHGFDGRIYEGHWEENIKFGFGNVIFPNGIKFLGFFSKRSQTYGLFTFSQGEGTLEFQGNLEKYNWQLNTYNNCEVARLKSGSKLSKKQSEDAWREDQKCNGEDREDRERGSEDERDGEWVRMWQGKGKAVVESKFEIEGVWQDGILVEYIYK